MLAFSPVREALGPTIRQLRKRKGLTQEELGKRLDVERQTVGRWERGEHYPSDAKFRQLPRALEVSREEFQQTFELQLTAALEKDDYPPFDTPGSDIAGKRAPQGRWIRVYVPHEDLEDLRR